MGGLSVMGGSGGDEVSSSQYHVHKVFLLCNYILLGAASSCIFLTLSLRLLPSLCGFFLILLHVVTIAGAVSGCAAAGGGSGSGRGKWYATHMVATVLTAIFQGSVSVLIFTNTSNILGNLKSYVREEDGAVILKLSGSLCVLIFFLEWIALVLAFFLRYYAYANRDEYGTRSAKVQHNDNVGNWPWALQV
ncbi:hypothetical protein SAY86_028763 [Trapa natans]|uniref:Uncharacterized protein n=1 Tax=Trapa natans TaxID=22666 RepID=A0AAN7M1Y0_TRANT|nr:hypothetical protein SAY86_028763 [Trapa natans]